MSEPEKLLRPNADSAASAAVHRIAKPEVGERSIQSPSHHPAFDEPDPLVTPKHSAAGGEAYFIIIGVAMVLIALFGHVALEIVNWRERRPYLPPKKRTAWSSRRKLNRWSNRSRR